jgi:hypothetical protein
LERHGDLAPAEPLDADIEPGLPQGRDDVRGVAACQRIADDHGVRLTWPALDRSTGRQRANDAEAGDDEPGENDGERGTSLSRHGR